MKRIFILCFELAFMFFACGAWAKNVTINLSPYKGKDVTLMLRNHLSGLNASDQATITLGKKGEYYISGTVEAKCNIIMKGVGKKSRFVLCNGTDTNEFKAFTDDTFFAFIGTLKNPITVEISNLSINLQEHKGLWWNKKNDGVRTEKFAVKIYHAKKVDVSKVNSLLKNAVCTNFNLRICSNITFHDCVLENYNNCFAGGILWIEGSTNNVNITRNVFNKYGNDEALAFYGDNVSILNGVTQRGSAPKSNIRVTDNVFNYGYSGEDKSGVMNDVLISIFTNDLEKGNACKFEDVTFENNELNITDPMRITMLLRFDEGDYHKNISVCGNKFVNEPNHSNHQRFYKTDIKILDSSNYQNMAPIEIFDNEFVNNECLLNNWGSTGLSHIQMEGGNVNFSNNIINDEQAAQDQKGGIITYITRNSTISLNGNQAMGLGMVACVSSSNMIEDVTINASGNTFEGVTTIYCDNVKRLNVCFDGNTLRSANMNFFLQEFAYEGAVVFKNNNVAVVGGNGELMTHWAKSDVKKLRFHTLEVTGNTFVGVKNANDMLVHIKNVGKKSINNNSFFP